jgi:hypothetical protein
MVGKDVERPSPSRGLLDSPVYVFQAEPDRPGSFRTVGSADGVEYSQVVIGHIAEDSKTIEKQRVAILDAQSLVEMSRLELAGVCDRGLFVNSQRVVPNAAAGPLYSSEEDKFWQVKNAPLALPHQGLPSVSTAESVLCSLLEDSDDG